MDHVGNAASITVGEPKGHRRVCAHSGVDSRGVTYKLHASCNTAEDFKCGTEQRGPRGRPGECARHNRALWTSACVTSIAFVVVGATSYGTHSIIGHTCEGRKAHVAM